MPEVRIGISGWRYPPWRKVFYPAGLAHQAWREQGSCGGADVVAYFDNDAKVAAPFDARRLMARLGVTPAAADG